MGGCTPACSNAYDASVADTGEGPGAKLAGSRSVGAAPADARQIVVPTPPTHVPASFARGTPSAPTQYTVPARASSAVAMGVFAGDRIAPDSIVMAAIRTPEATEVTSAAA